MKFPAQIPRRSADRDTVLRVSRDDVADPRDRSPDQVPVGILRDVHAGKRIRKRDGAALVGSDEVPQNPLPVVPAPWIRTPLSSFPEMTLRAPANRAPTLCRASRR